MTSFWSLWVIVLTVVSLVLVTWVLFANRKREDKATKETTGHVYDGIEEYENPLPAWWFYMFVITIVWGVGYLIAYPGMGNFPGVLGWTQEKQHEQRVADADERFGALRAAYLQQDIVTVSQDPAARKMGMRIFGNNCAQCHGADARGAYGFPNLTDNDWLYGDSPEAIQHSIAKGRIAAMPAWGTVISEQDISDVTAHVLNMNGEQTGAYSSENAERVYTTYCVACHGQDGGGNQALGAPALNNGIWLYGGTATQIAHSIRAGRNGNMPAQEALLGEDKIHLLTAYVFGLSRQ